MLLLLGSVYLIRRTTFVFVIALLFAYLLYPLMDLIDRHLPSKTRTPALAITFILVIGILAAFGVSIGSAVAEQAASLAAQAPALLDKLRQAPAPGAQVPLRNEALNWIGRAAPRSTTTTSPCWYRVWPSVCFRRRAI